MASPSPYVPGQPQTYMPGMPQQPQRSWFGRNAIWLIPTGILGGLCTCGVCCGGILMTTFAAMQNSQPYQMALQAVQNSPQVVERLGEPIEGGMPMGEFSETNGSGTAQFTFTVTGPNGDASVSTSATMTNNVWVTDSLVVQFSDGQSVDLTEGNFTDEGGMEMDTESIPEPDAP